MADAPLAPILWFRPSIRRAAYRASGLAIALTVAGAFVLGGLRVADIDFGSPWLMVYAVGLGLVIAGPALLLRRSFAFLGHERVLTIHRDGLRWQVGERPPSFVSWEALGAMVIEDDALVIEAGREIWNLPLPFEGITAERLIGLCSELRQKALLGLPVRPRDDGEGYRG
ncbi:MAG: hypothetical protein IT385_12715 [Deltaproteobacteria bacterium]|nr:hypothetical protein [Deltaproteobacteria bacterium]